MTEFKHLAYECERHSVKQAQFQFLTWQGFTYTYSNENGTQGTLSLFKYLRQQFSEKLILTLERLSPSKLRLCSVTWFAVWNNPPLENAYLIDGPTQPLEDFKLPCQKWVSLNLVGTGHGRCGFLMHQKKLRDNPACEGSIETQTIGTSGVTKRAQRVQLHPDPKAYEAQNFLYFLLFSEVER